MADVRPLAGLSSARPRLQAEDPSPPIQPSGLTCSCSSPSTCTVKTLPRLSRPEMASRDLDAAPQGEGEGTLAVGSAPPPGTQLSPGRTVQAWAPPPTAPAASRVPARKAHSRVSMTQGLNADEHPHCVPSPRPRPALQLPVVCGDRPSLPQGGQSRVGRWLDCQGRAQEPLRPGGEWALSENPPPLREVGMEQEAPLQWDPGLGAGPHSPTCRLAENWKMAVTGAVNRPEARLKPDPRRKAPCAVGWRDSR